MSWIEEADPDHECPPNYEHHPIDWECGNSACDCREDYDGLPYRIRVCHVCRQRWPCETNQKEVAARERQEVIDESMSKLETIGDPYVHTNWPNKGRTCILAAPFEGSRIVGDGLFLWTTIIWEHGGGLSPDHRCLLNHPS